MKEKFEIVMAILMSAYILALIVRRIWKGVSDTWMSKMYFYVETMYHNEFFAKKIKCKRIGYILNPFKKTMTLIVPPVTGTISGEIRIKIYRDWDNKDGVYNIKRIEGGNTNEIFYSLIEDKYKCRRTIKEALDSAGSKGTVISNRKTLVFKGRCDAGILTIYDYRKWTKRELKELN